MTQPPIAHRPYIAAGTQLPEMTLRAVLMGTVLGIIFGASSLYLVQSMGSLLFEPKRHQTPRRY